MTTKYNTDKLFKWIIQKEKFHELILSQDGRIYPAPCFENTTDWSRAYYNGNVSICQDDDLFCVGSLPEKELNFPVFAGNTSFYKIEDSGVFLHSKGLVLDDTSVFAVFRYQGLLGLYIADSMVSKDIYFFLTAYSPEEESFYNDNFQRLVHRHDPETAEKLATWLQLHAASGKEV